MNIFDYNNPSLTPEHDEYEQCYSCKDSVPYDEVDEYRFSIIPTPQDIKLKKIRFRDELVCTRCTESFGD